TDQKKAEIALRESEARKSAVVSSALDGIITFDEIGIITDFNPAAEGIFGHVRTAVVGKPMADVIVPPNLRERHRRSMAQYLATGESTILGKRIELTGLHANGTEFPMELAVCRLESSPPEFTGFI